MPTVVNDLVLEPATPAAAEPRRGDADARGAPGSRPAGPELERQVQRVGRRERERRLRLWAH